MGLLKASTNLNIIYPKERLAQTEDHLKSKKKATETISPFKKKVPIQTNKSHEDKSNSQEGNTKKGISQVYFVDSNNKPISGTFKQTQLKAVILSSGLKGKDVKVTVYEEDELSNDTLFEKTVTLSGDKTFVIVDLCEIPKSKGEDTAKIGSFVLYEDNIQELFVDVEVLETHAHLKSKTINVDIKAFKMDTPSGVSKLVVEKPEVKKEEKNEKKVGQCYCNKNLTSQILIDVGVSPSKALIFLESINKTFADYDITSCLRKAHFLAQVIHESVGFNFTEEQNVLDTAYGGFKGRGLLQLTGKSNYEAYGLYENEDFTTSLENKQKLEELPFSARLAGWFWAIKAKLNDEADKNDHISLTRIINGGFNGYNDRTKNIIKGFKVLYNNCENDSGKNTTYEFKLSKTYNVKKGSFAWGLWHDPGLLKVKGCIKDKDKAVEGYTRFLELIDKDFDERDWFRIHKLIALKNLRYKTGKKNHVKVLDVVNERLKILKE